MKLTLHWAIGFIAFIGLISCEEVIELDLGDAPPRIVIEGKISTDPGPYHVKIHQSVDYAESNVFPPVSGATVSLTDEEGNAELLEEVTDGLYQTKILQGESGKTYTTQVDYEGQSYAASSTIPETTIPIKSLTYRFEDESLFIQEGYYMTAFFADPVDEVNYYRLKVFVNGEPYYFERDNKKVRDDNFWLINDKFFNGKVMDFEFPHTLKPGDRVVVELHQVDQATYDYYRTLVDLMGPGGVAPANPLTNWSNGALGYFGGISVSKVTLVILDKSDNPS